MKKYYAIYKPFGMLSQFSREGNRPTLADLGEFDKNIYPVGRLDADSEGLLILTNDRSLNSQLLDPSQKHDRTYYVQIEGEINEEALIGLNQGLILNIKGKMYHTKPAKASMIETPVLPERDPPVRFRKNIPTTWISLKLQEGKNRQVRKMTAAVGFPTLRLVRWAIEDLTVANFQSGEVRQITERDIFEQLKIN